MRFKADIGEMRHSGLFKEKLDRGRPDDDGIAGQLTSACRLPHSPKVLVSRSVPIRAGVLAPFHPPLSPVVPFVFSTCPSGVTH
jgi:hypothetical protein